MLDLAKVRAHYFDPPPPDPERVPTREEIYARYERERFEACVERGGDPEAEGLGPHGSMIGGRGKPLTAFHGFPELRAQLRPLPLSWFDHPRAKTTLVPPGGLREAHAFFHCLSCSYLAGMSERPSGAQLRSHFKAPELDAHARSDVWHVLACIRNFELHRLLARGAVCVREVARAMHLSETRRATVVAWINQFSAPPRDGAGA